MRRIARHLFALCSLLSLLLFVAVCVLWARSYVRGDVYSRDGGYSTGGVIYSRWIVFDSSCGVLLLFVAYDDGDAGQSAELVSDYADGEWHSEWTTKSDPTPIEELQSAITGNGIPIRLGFAYSRARMAGNNEIVLAAPYGLFALLATIAPTLSLRRLLVLRRRVARGRCPTCGYDLRATPDRCPECGTTPAAT
jgi:hypothetical protein